MVHTKNRLTRVTYRKWKWEKKIMSIYYAIQKIIFDQASKAFFLLFQKKSILLICAIPSSSLSNIVILWCHDHAIALAQLIWEKLRSIFMHEISLDQFIEFTELRQYKKSQLILLSEIFSLTTVDYKIQNFFFRYQRTLIEPTKNILLANGEDFRLRLLMRLRVK